jgi:hypothetical protein
MTSLTGALAMFLGAIPRVLAFAVILIVGWFVASLIARGLGSRLRAMNFNELSERSGFSGFVRNTGVRTDASGVLAHSTKWFVRLITMILVIAGLSANAVSGIVRGAARSAGVINRIFSAESRWLRSGASGSSSRLIRSVSRPPW